MSRQLTFFFPPVEMLVKWPVSSSGCSCCNISQKAFWFLFFLLKKVTFGYNTKITNVFEVLLQVYQQCLVLCWCLLCWCFIWVLVELNIIIVKEKPCQHSYSQEETKYDYSMKSCVGKQEPRTFELLSLDKSLTTFNVFFPECTTK